MKIAVNTYSFNRCNFTQFEMLDKALEMGFDAVEIVGLKIPEGYTGTPVDFAKEVRDYAAKTGILLSAYTIGADLFRDGEAERLKKEVDIAEALGVHFMRHDVTWSLPDKSKTYFDYIPFFASVIREVTDYAETKGVKTCTENHGQISQDSDRVTALCRAVDRSNFGLLVDIGNFMCADQISVDAVREAAPYAIYVHAKDFHYLSKEDAEKSAVKKQGENLPSVTPVGYFSTRGGNFLAGCALGDGVVDVRECIKIIKDTGYDGFVSVEFEGHEGDPISEIGKGLKLLRELV